MQTPLIIVMMMMITMMMMTMTTQIILIDMRVWDVTLLQCTGGDNNGDDNLTLF